MKETRERKKEKYKEKKVNLYIFNEKCTFFRKKFSMTKKKGRQNFFRELKGTFKDFFLKIYFPKIFAPPIFVTKIFAPPIFMTSLRPWRLRYNMGIIWDMGCLLRYCFCLITSINYNYHLCFMPRLGNLSCFVERMTAMVY